MEELKEWDISTYNMYIQILSPNLTLVDLSLDDSLTFSVNRRSTSGDVTTIDLIENGRNITVTDANKHEYVQLVVNYKLRNCFQEQMEAIIEGLYSIIPFEILSIFNAGELQILTSINENEDIDIDDLEKHTLYGNGYHSHDATILRFYRVLRSFNKTEKRNFLQFVTGSRHVPIGGFACLKSSNSDNTYAWFKIVKVSGISNRQLVASERFGGNDDDVSPPGPTGTYIFDRGGGGGGGGGGGEDSPSSWNVGIGNDIPGSGSNLGLEGSGARAEVLVAHPTLLPTCHTCFNQLDLPPYENESIMREKLLKAIESCEGFGFA